MAGIKIVAEIGCNHRGDFETARDMVRIAAQRCGADVVKFQKRCNRELLSPEDYAAPHPVPANAYGASYGAHREFLEFNLDQHRELQALCQDYGAQYSTSVWDMTSAVEIAALRPALIKIPSATNQNFDLQDYLCHNFEGEIHVSTGMTTAGELDALVTLYERAGRSGDLVLYACTSGYPVPPEQACLLEIDRLQTRYGPRVGALGYSGHHLGTALDLAAIGVGAACAQRAESCAPFRYLERHFTLDKSWRGTDHAASLEPDELKLLVSHAKAVCSALRYKESDILDIEVPQRHKLKWKQMERQKQTGTMLESAVPAGKR